MSDKANSGGIDTVHELENKSSDPLKNARLETGALQTERRP